jgi:hypothetical protein
LIAEDIHVAARSGHHRRWAASRYGQWEQSVLEGVDRRWQRVIAPRRFRRTDPGTLTMSTTKAEQPRPRRMLDGFPPETRVVIADVTCDAYESLVDAVGECENCRVAHDGRDIELRFD